jgi:beta-aspartyl-dipeptidase (metallo-type)
VIFNGSLFTPTVVKSKNVFISGERILKFVDVDDTDALIKALRAANVTVKEVDAAGGSIIPGLIDPHVHANGAGGEMGYGSRTPEAPLSELISAGLTSIVGLMGTDTVTRGQKDLLAKLKGLGQDLNTYMWIGGYREPGPTLTGSVQSDILLIKEVIGVGELAISDHRSSWPSNQQLLATVSDARVGGLLAGKAGVVQFHVGSANTVLTPLWKIVNETTIPITNLFPTHVTSRGADLIADALRWNKAGGDCCLFFDGGFAISRQTMMTTPPC